MKTEQIGSGTKVTLMSTTSEKGLVYIDNDQSSIKQAIDDKISDIAAGTDGIEGLRLPTLEELKYIKDNVDAINDNLDNLGKSRFLIGSGTLYSYYFLDEDGTIKSYCPYWDKPDSTTSCISTNLKSERNSIILRAFVTITFTE